MALKEREINKRYIRKRDVERSFAELAEIGENPGRVPCDRLFDGLIPKTQAEISSILEPFWETPAGKKLKEAGVEIQTITNDKGFRMVVAVAGIALTGATIAIFAKREIDRRQTEHPKEGKKG